MNTVFNLEAEPFELAPEFELKEGIEFDPGNFESETGRWMRRGGVVILDDLAPSATAADSELSSGFSRSVPFFPAKPAGFAGRAEGIPVSLFPPKPANPLTTSTKMKQALDNAIRTYGKLPLGAPLDTFPVRFTFVDVTNTFGSFPSAGHLDIVTDYIASEAKVAVMYSAYALRDMVQRFAAWTGANSANLFA